jgi:RecB family endonuclease NucS
VPLYDKPVRLLMKDMAPELLADGQASFTRKQAIDWFARKYPKIKQGTVQCHLLRLSTNVQSRVNWKPIPGDDDFFFQMEDGRFRLYDAAHDPAPIHSRSERSEALQEVESADSEDVAACENSSEFAYEKDLKNYLAKNLTVLEPGLTLYEDEDCNGIEFPVGGRFIDILAVDAKGHLVVIELKVSRGYDRVIGQLIRYMAWIRQNHADPGQNVRGIIVAREITSDLVLACSELKGVQLFEYRLAFSVKPVAAQARG